MLHHFAFSNCSWHSQGRNNEVVCHFLLQWTTFCQNCPSWPIHLGWPWMTELNWIYVVCVCCCYWSVAKSCPPLCDPWTEARQASLSFTISQSLFKLMSIESVMPSKQLILCCPLLLSPSIFSSIRAFSSESALHIMWPGFCFGASASALVLQMNNQDWFPLRLTGSILLSKGLKRLFQPHNLNFNVCATEASTGTTIL